jgi:hypothetical protein
MAKQLKRTHEAQDAATLRQVVTDAGRLLPSAVVRSDRRTVMVNVAEEPAIALAQQVKAQGITREQLVCRTLKAGGVPMDPLDLEDRTPRRRAA